MPNAMPKQKTHKGTKKRFRMTANGKIKHRQAGTSHLQSRMSKKRRRQLRGTDTLRSALDTKRLTIALAGNSY
jgi:large subunit ribosomal protein L35